MSYSTPDVYCQPEHFGLTPIGELDDPEADYSFDLLVVWKHEDGRLFWANDAGCSCPSPFEYLTSLDSDEMHLITDETWREFSDAVNSHCLPYVYGAGPGKPDPQAADKTELLAKVAALMPRVAS